MSRREVARWSAEIGRRTGRPVNRVQDPGPTAARPVAVGLERRMRQLTADDCELLVVPDASPLLSSTQQAIGPPYDEYPVVGFLNREPRWDPLERLRALQWFGGVVTPHMAGLTDPRPSVATVTVPTAVPLAGLGWRDRLWSDCGRIRAVAVVARDAAANPTAPRVALLVERSADASALAALLPGWSVLSGTGPSDIPPLAIATDGWRGAYPAARLDILVDARAADPLSPVPVTAGGQLIDLRDRGDRELERRHQHRLRAYAQAGLVVRPAA